MFLLPEQLIDAREKAGREPWKSYAAELREAAEGMCNGWYPREEAEAERSLFLARFFCRSVVTLAAQYVFSGQERYAARAWEFIEDMLSRPHWCAEPNENECGQVIEVDLAVGEIAFALSCAIDLLGAFLGASKRARLIAAARERIFEPYLAVVDTADDAVWPWWYMARMNWNAVCNGGILCLALCLEGEEPLAERAIGCALQGLEEFVDSLHLDGSCEEGIGYWLYGHLYHLYAGVAYENKYRRRWAAFDSPKLKNALDFPFDFSPDEAGLSFNDVNWFNPTGALYEMINRTGQAASAHALTERLLDYRAGFAEHPVYVKQTAYMWPSEAFALAFCRHEYDPNHRSAPLPPVKVYPDNGWGLFSAPNGLRLSLRSGNSGVNHGCRDLNAIQVARGGALLIENVGNHPYPQGWFGATRKLFFEDSTAAKSSMLVNGIGQTGHATAQFGYDERSMWSQAAHAYPLFMRSVLRTVSILEDGLLIEDEFENPSTPRGVYHESRFYSAGVFERVGENSWRVVGGGQSMTLLFQSDRELAYALSRSIPSMPISPALNMLRVYTAQPSTNTKISTTLL